MTGLPARGLMLEAARRVDEAAAAGTAEPVENASIPFDPWLLNEREQALALSGDSGALSRALAESPRRERGPRLRAV